MMTIAVLTLVFMLACLSLSVFFVKVELTTRDIVNIERSAVSPAVTDIRAKKKERLIIW